MTSSLVFDIEADSLLDDVTVIHCIVTKERETGVMKAYHNSPSFTPWDGTIADGCKALEEADVCIGQNIIRYDIPALQKVEGAFEGVGLDFYANKVRDTLLMSQVAWPDIEYRKDLPWQHKLTKTKAGRMVPITGYSLDSFGKRLGRYKGDPGGGWDTFTQQMLTYCCTDVEVTAALIDTLENPAYYLGMEPYGDSVWANEHMFAYLMFIQQQHGWPFDVEEASALQALLQERIDELHDKLAHLVPPTEKVGKKPMYYCHPEYPGQRWPTKGALQDYLREHRTDRTLKERMGEVHAGPPKVTLIYWNPGSRDQVRKLLYDQYDWKPTKWATKNNTTVEDHVDVATAAKLRTQLGPDGKPKWHEVIDDDVLSSLGVPALEPLAEYFYATKMLSMLATGAKAHMKALGADRRIHGRVNPAKVLGGRCGHSDPNVAQVPKTSSKKPLNARFRACYTCLPGHKLVGFDAKALEYRIMGHFGFPYDEGELASIVDDPDKDLHWELTKKYGLVSGISADTPRDEDNEEWETARGDAKGLNYAIPYGAQPPKIGRMLGCSKEGAEELLDYMRITMPGMIGLRDAIVAAVEKRGEVKVTRRRDGKEYRKYVPHTGWVKGMDGRVNVIRSAHASLNTKLQGDGGLYMKRLLIELIMLCQEEGLRVHGVDCPFWETNRAAYDVALLGNIHDEAQCSVAEDKVELFRTLVQKAFDRANTFYKMRCPVRGDSKVGNTWKDTH